MSSQPFEEETFRVRFFHPALELHTVAEEGNRDILLAGTGQGLRGNDCSTKEMNNALCKIGVPTLPDFATIIHAVKPGLVKGFVMDFRRFFADRHLPVMRIKANVQMLPALVIRDRVKKHQVAETLVCSLNGNHGRADIF